MKIIIIILLMLAATTAQGASVGVIDIEPHHAGAMIMTINDYAPDATVYLMLVKDADDLFDAIVFMVALKVDIISMSICRETPKLREEAAIYMAAQRGIVMVAAAGNKNWLMDRLHKAAGMYSEVKYPANYPQVIAVTGDERGSSFACARAAGMIARRLGCQ